MAMTTIIRTPKASAVRRSEGVRPSRVFQPDIEGLRAIAVIAVVAFHAAVPFIGGGFVGVDVFFVISGYLITGQLLREVLRTGRISLPGFYARRARRILPGASIVLLAITLATVLFEPVLGVFHTAKDLLAAATYTTNWHFIALGTDYLAQSTASSPVLHFWSLAVEEQFYLVWPLLILVAAQFAKKRPMHGTRVIAIAIFSVTVASFATGVLLTASDPKLAYMATQTRAWEFGVGALIAVVAHWFVKVGSSRIREFPIGSTVGAVIGWGGLLTVLYAVFTLNSDTPFPGTAALLPALGTGGIIVGGLVSGTGMGSVGSLLSLRPVRYIGRLSYAWYLWHWPVLIFVELKTGTLPWQQRALLMALALGLAALTVHFIEIPISRWKSVAKQVAPAIALGILCMVLTAGAALGVGSSAVVALGAAGTSADSALVTAAFGKDLGKNAGPVTPTAFNASGDVPLPISCLLDAQPIVSGCAVGPVGGTPVALFGDSHANQWLPAMTTMATRYHWRVTVYTRSGCPVPNIAPRADGSRFSAPVCINWRQNAIKAIQKLKPALVVVSSLDTYIPDQGEMLTAWNSSLDKLRKTGAPIAYIRDTPTPTTDIPTCISGAANNWSKCAFKPLNHIEPVIEQSILGNENDIKVIDLYHYLCTGATCPAVRNGLLLYRDDSHITATAAKALEPALNAAFVKDGLIPAPKSSKTTKSSTTTTSSKTKGHAHA
jgi:peptidoglycan/LPS O-acetylase OafA/YrhL